MKSDQSKFIYEPVIWILLFLWMSQSYARVILIEKNSNWKYLDNGSNQQTAWRDVSFNDSLWPSGNAKLGFGDGNNITILNNHQLPTQTGAATWYFRHEFTVNNSTNYNNVYFNLLRDDGAVVYLNGIEIGRSNMPVGDIYFDTLAHEGVGGTNEILFFSSVLLANNLQDGKNVMAIEIHQRGLNSSDIGMDFELIATNGNLARQAYLQSQSPTSIIIKWRTHTAINSRVKWGLELNSLNNIVDNPALKTEHEVQLTGLRPSSKVYYSIGTDLEEYAGNSEDYHFIMPPPMGSQQKARFWVIGDSGTANANALAVKNSFLQFNQNTDINLWIMLGDNAYITGTDSQYDAAVFDMYPELLTSSALWSTIGNHDSASASSLTQTGVYYDTFSFPKSAYTDGISSGADSGTEAYYSFDYGNVHFIVLESHQSNATFRSGMIDWLYNDLALSLSDWVIAFWHHPPYTKGTHDSDTENKLIYMRENILEILENNGVDLVLGGHSHTYERSWLIDGHYDHSDTFNKNLHVISGSEGTPGISAYNKQNLGQTPHEGTVYLVAGNSGTFGPGQGEPHEAMRNTLALSELGSLIIDVDARVMDVRFLNSTNEVKDVFRITKHNLIFINSFDLQ